MAEQVVNTKPMKVANMTFLVDLLGEDCAPLQYVRELTQNALDGIALLGSPGEVIWDVSWPYYKRTGVYKLSCIDTGIGMTGPEMVRYINELSSSVHAQSRTGNFGVGAKIAAAPRNPEGMVYMSWKDGVGHMIHLWFDPEADVYGLKRWDNNDGEFWTPVSDGLKPEQIKKHGTVVTLLGRTADDNTLEPPDGTPMPSRWVLRYLNTRYFNFPKTVTVKAREGWQKPNDNRHNFLRVVDGQEPWLNQNAESMGLVHLSDVTARWWILKENIDKNSGHNAGGGHMAALFQNELYELMSGRAGLARLQGFGVIFGTDRVVIYLEPKTKDVSANTARTQLLIGGEPLDWSNWAAQFRDKMPQEIVELQERIGARSGEKDHRNAIRERLKQIQELLKFSRFRPEPRGDIPVNLSEGVGGEPEPQDGRQHGDKKPGKEGGRAGDVYALFAEAGVEMASEVDTFSEPETRWISVHDKTRSPGILDDRAAKFIIEENLLLINADFRVFTDMTQRWEGSYQHVPGVKATVKEVVHEWFEQQLVEAVMSAQALKKGGRWSADELKDLWKEESLTATVLPRWHIDRTIRQMLGQRLGSLKT